MDAEGSAIRLVVEPWCPRKPGCTCRRMGQLAALSKSDCAPALDPKVVMAQILKCKSAPWVIAYKQWAFAGHLADS
eukprot:1060849-Pyramimonas_sp.AAC.1